MAVKRAKKRTPKKKARKTTAKAKRKPRSKAKKPVRPVLTGSPVRDPGGKFVAGHEGMGGRPPGLREGQKALCRVIDDYFKELVDSGDIREAFEGLRNRGKDKIGVLAIMKLVGFDYFRRGIDHETPPQQDITIRVGLPRTVDDVDPPD